MSTKTLEKMITKMDIFANESPRFLLKGSDKMPTFIGGIVSILMCTVIGIYALLKMN